MIPCIVIGDSIAVGLGQDRPDCETVAKGGITSGKYVATLLNSVPAEAATAVISLGVNDSADEPTLDNLRHVRASFRARQVVWLLPGIKPNVQRLIHQVASENFDLSIDTTSLAGPDHLHPTGQGYQQLALDTTNLTANSLGSIPLSEQQATAQTRGRLPVVLYRPNVETSSESGSTQTFEQQPARLGRSSDIRRELANGSSIIPCIVIGDSIAGGLGQHRPDCETVAKSGITSDNYIATLLNSVPAKAATAVISLGVNDSADEPTLDNLRRVRASFRARQVIWLLPGIKPNVQSLIHQVASENHDLTIDTTSLAGPDHLHPTGQGYQQLALETTNLMAYSLGSIPLSEQQVTTQKSGRLPEVLYRTNDTTSSEIATSTCFTSILRCSSSRTESGSTRFPDRRPPQLSGSSHIDHAFANVPSIHVNVTPAAKPSSPKYHEVQHLIERVDVAVPTRRSPPLSKEESLALHQGRWWRSDARAGNLLEGPTKSHRPRGQTAQERLPRHGAV